MIKKIQSYQICNTRQTWVIFIIPISLLRLFNFHLYLLYWLLKAVNENENLKRTIFSDISKNTKENTILATNTSSISITKIASFSKKPENVVGMHFFNPVPLMALLEIIPGL